MLRAKSWAVTDEFWGRAQALSPVRQRLSNKTCLRRTFKTLGGEFR